MGSPDDIWQALTRETQQGTGWLRRRVHPASTAELFYAVSQPDGAPALLLEVETRAVPPELRPPDSRGLQLKVETLAPGPGGRTRLCVVLRQLEFRQVFEILV